jgi:hypothetical protein
MSMPRNQLLRRPQIKMMTRSLEAKSTMRVTTIKTRMCPNLNQRKLPRTRRWKRPMKLPQMRRKKMNSKMLREMTMSNPIMNSQLKKLQLPLKKRLLQLKAKIMIMKLRREMSQRRRKKFKLPHKANI